MITIGIDPGKSGGIAWSIDGQMSVAKMPETLQDLWELIGDIADLVPASTKHLECKAYIEQVSAMPGQGVTSCFTFGRGLGQLEMALTAASIPFERVTPQKWQKSMGCLTKGDKNVSKRRAQELYPELKVTHATADALLIATYGTRQP